MKTYQDYLKEINDGKSLIKFVRDCIEDYKSSDMYKTAVLAQEYDEHKNRTILNYQKMLYTLSGATVPDNFSANYKIPSRHFQRLATQQASFSLGNGIVWADTKTGDKVGDKFDKMVYKAGRGAIVQGVTYGFWNLDHLEVFMAKEFAPLLDEQNGSLRAGIRFWQIDDTKPLRAVFYEEDGYTNFIYVAGKDGEIMDEKSSYISYLEGNNIDGMAIYDGENYPTFPIIPCYCNEYHQSEFVGMQEDIDAYDLIKSGLANDIDDCSQIYWTMQNAGGMDDADLALFLQRLKTIHVAQTEQDGVTIEPHTVDVPWQARKEMLELLENDIYKDFMAFNHESIANGAVNIPQIKASYELLNEKADLFELQILDFLEHVLQVIGITDETPSFERSMIANTSEEIDAVLKCANYLDAEYVTRKLLTILGDGDKADDMIDKMNSESLQTFTAAFGGAVEPEGTTEEGEASANNEGNV